MGRKIDMKKIEDVTKCQVTFSKRRSSLMKKANEIAVCCDVDVAFVAFSPSGRVSKFCNQKRIEDVLHRYVNLPADKRLNHISNVQGKLEKLKQLSHINGDTSKLHYLDKQIENLELQIKKTGLELQILETDLRDYEINPEQEPSLHQLSWCERNLNHSLQRVIARKREQVELESQSRNPIPTSLDQNKQVPTINEQVPMLNEQVPTIENPISGQILMQLDPWISPYSAKVRESIFQDIVGQAKEPVNENIIINQQIPSNNMSKAPIQESLPISSEQCNLMMDQPVVFTLQEQSNFNLLQQQLMADQPLFNFHDQNDVGAYNNAASVVFSDAIHMSTQSLCSIQDPTRSRPIASTSTKNPSVWEMPTPSLLDEIGSSYQCINSNLMSQFSNMEGSQEIGNAYIRDNNILFNGSNSTRNHDNIFQSQDFRSINVDQPHITYQEQGAYNVHHHKVACQETQFDNLLFEETNEDSSIWSSNLQRNSSLWEWDDLLLDQNFNFQNLPPV